MEAPKERANAAIVDAINPPPAPVASEDESKTDPLDTRFERARAALLRTGALTDAEIHAMDRQKVIRRGLKVKRQLDWQAADFARLKSEAERKGESSQAASNGATLSGVPAPADDPLLAELLTALDLADDPAAKAALSAKLSPVLSERAQLKRDLEQRSHANGSDANQIERCKRVRTQLAESIPEAADDDDWKRHVEPAIVQLAALPRFAGADRDDAVLRDLFETATRMSLEEVGERDRSTWSNGSASAGAMETSSVSSSAPRSVASVPRELTAEQAKQAALNQFKANRQRRGSLAGLRGN
jgi:hypothetical protein